MAERWLTAMADLIPVPDDVARTAALALERRTERGGGGTRNGVVMATALTTGFVRPVELAELRAWHTENPDAVQGDSSTLLGGMYGGAAGRAWPRVAAAQNPVGTGVMISLPVPTAVSDAIARSDGEPADAMHVTLFSFGDADELDPSLRDKLGAIVGQAAAASPAPPIDMGHVERFTAGDSGLEPATLVDDGPQVYALRAALQEALDAAGIEYADNHAFRAHVTIGYYKPGDGPESGAIDPPQQWTPSCIEIHWGPDIDQYPFAGAVPTTAALKKPVTAKLAKLNTTVNRTNQRLLVRLHTAATVALQEALRQAGIKVVGKARNENARAVARAAVEGGVTSAMLASVGVTEQEFLDRRFDTFGALATGLIATAERRKLTAVARVIGVNPDDLEEQYGDTIDTRAAAASGLMVASLGLLARQALSGHAVTAENAKGEFSGPVPFGIVRQAFDVAARGAHVPQIDETGPGPSAVDQLGAALTGVGQTLVQELLGEFADEIGQTQTRKTWIVGDPDRPFEPHQALDGTEWTTDDYPPELAADSGEWPYVDVYEPGDHDGCSCEIVEDIEAVDGAGDFGEAIGADAGGRNDLGSF